MMIATDGRNLRGSDVVLYLEAAIYTFLLLYCCETELSSVLLFLKQTFVHGRGYLLCFSSDYLVFGFKLQYGAFSEESIMS